MLSLPDLASNARRENTKRWLEMNCVTPVCCQERLQQRALPPQTNVNAPLANLKMLVNARIAKLAGIVQVMAKRLHVPRILTQVPEQSIPTLVNVLLAFILKYSTKLVSLVLLDF